MWKELISLKDDLKIVNSPWIVLGDFNQTLHPEQRSRPMSLNIDAKMRLFRETLTEADLGDLAYKGSKFTWTNKIKTNLIAKNLDRVLVNDEWLSLFPDSVTSFGESAFSDHAVCRMILKPSLVREKRHFRFYNYLLHNEKFLEFLMELWYSVDATGYAVYIISRKLKMIKNGVRTLSRDNYSNLEKRAEEAHVILLSAQHSLLIAPSVINVIAESLAHKSWLVLAKEEERFLFQRSHINWTQGGDCNSSYYNRLIATRKSFNHIHFLINNQGIRVERQQAVQNMCIEYFSNLLGSDQVALLDPQDLTLLMPFRCLESELTDLTKDFTRQDIRDAFFELPANKTSGPDGYPAEFFTGAWNIFGPEATDAVLEFFRSGKLLKQ